MKRVSLSLALIVPIGLWAQSSASPQGAQNLPKPGRIEGRVYNAITNEPVRKATVTIASTGNAPQQNGAGIGAGTGAGIGAGPFGGGGPGGGSRLSVTTDAEGKFLFEGVSPGNYRVTAEKAGFVRMGGFGGPGGPFGGGGGALGSTLRVTEGGAIGDFRLKLMPQGILSGKVLDEDGEPFGQVRVTAMEWNYTRDAARLQPVGTAETDELGSFRISNLSPGRYYLAVEKAGGFAGRGGLRGAARGAAQQAPLVKGTETFAYTRTYYPGVEEIGQAERIPVQAGQEMSGLSLTLRKSRVFSVSGTVLGIEGDGRQFVQLSRAGSNDSMPGPMGGGMMGRVTEGRFTINNVAPGNYTIRVGGMADRRARVVARGEVNISNDNVSNVSLGAVSPGAVKGRVRLDGNVPNANLQSLRLELRSLESGGFGGGGLNLPLAADGSFAVADLSPELYAVNLAAERLGLYVKSVAVNGQDIRQRGLDLRAGGTLEVDLLLSPKVASVNGGVKMEEGAEAGSVLVVKEPYDPRQPGVKILRASVGSDGTFSVANLEPGNYRVLAVEEVDTKTMYDPEWLAAHQAETVTVEVGEGATKAVSLRQIRK